MEIHHFMKTKILFFLFLFLTSFVEAQTTLTLQPDATTGKDSFLSDNIPNDVQSSSPELDAGAWTIFGSPLKIRGLLGFNLSSIPVNAIIQSATLTLYNNPNSQNGYANGQHSHVSGSNEAVLQRIISPWDENVTWNTQPATTDLNQVILPQDTDPHQDYTLDVKTLVEDMIADPSFGYGFMLKLQEESPYRILVFASSNHPNAALHPKLEITYTTCTQLTLQPNAADGKDTLLSDNIPNDSQGNSTELNAGAWTIFGSPVKLRGLLGFDLSSVPSGATIQYANLTLYNNPNAQNGYGNGQHSHVSGSNESVLQRITSSWDENTTWNNQPSSTSTNQVILPEDTDPYQDYVVDVKQLVQDMIADPSAGYGFLLRLQEEAYYRILVFASSDHPNADLHPKLELCYTSNLSTNDVSNQQKTLAFYPNPSSGLLHIKTDRGLINPIISIFDLTGKKVFENKYSSNVEIFDVNVSYLQNGIYECILTSENSIQKGKIVILK